MTYHFTHPHTRRQRFQRFLLVLGSFLAVILIATVIIRHVYDRNLQPLSNNPKTQIVTIQQGLSANQIAALLRRNNLIRSSWAFEWYVRSQSLRSDLQAGTYALAPDQSVQEIVSTITQGRVATRLVTIIPGARLDQVQAAFINDGFSPTAVDNALKPDQYQDLLALADKPTGASLEGLLYPDSFQKNADTDPSVIIRESLIEMGQHLTPAIRTAFTQEGLTTYQGLILASIVEHEVNTPNDQAQVAQVFIKRLHIGMALQSDVTAIYGAILAGQSPNINYDSAYNTHLNTGLPPTPIGTVNDQVINAVAHPANTDWLFFVAGDDGVTHFAQTAQEHQANVNQYCHQKCAQTSQ